MSKVHWGEKGKISPICGRVPNWVKLATDKGLVTCRLCLKKLEVVSE